MIANRKKARNDIQLTLAPGSIMKKRYSIRNRWFENSVDFPNY